MHSCMVVTQVKSHPAVCYLAMISLVKCWYMLYIIVSTSVSTSKLKFTIGMLPFGTAIGAMIVIIVIVITVFILITMALVRSRRALHVDLECLKVKTIEQPAIYEELDYVHMMSPKPAASSPTISIDTRQNTAYLSVSGLLNK